MLQNQYDNTPITLGTLLHYLGNLKIQISADIQQIWKKGSVATCPRCGGECSVGFEANFMRFPTVKKF